MVLGKMSFFYAHKYKPGMDIVHRTCIRIRRAYYDTHDQFLRVLDLYKEFDDFQLELPQSCITRLLQSHDWNDNHVIVDIPNDLLDKPDDYMRYVVGELRKRKQ
jgi:hypothetical protein